MTSLRAALNATNKQGWFSTSTFELHVVEFPLLHPEEIPPASNCSPLHSLWCFHCPLTYVKQAFFSINNHFAASTFGMHEMCQDYFGHCFWVGVERPQMWPIGCRCRAATVALDKLAHATFHLNLIFCPSYSSTSYGPV